MPKVHQMYTNELYRDIQENSIDYSLILVLILNIHLHINKVYWILIVAMKISIDRYELNLQLNLLFPFLKERVICEKFALKIHKVCLSVYPKPIKFQH